VDGFLRDHSQGHRRARPVQGAGSRDASGAVSGAISIEELPVYRLIVAKGGSKLKESAADVEFGVGVSVGQTFEVKFSGASMAALVNPCSYYPLSASVDHPVFDKTGLSGKYDFTLRWNALETDDSDAPSIFTAMTEQLGLKLESAKSPVEVLVIDHVERPSEN
jgi:uncharacterized protein (TIGR03435 family)